MIESITIGIVQTNRLLTKVAFCDRDTSNYWMYLEEIIIMSNPEKEIKVGQYWIDVHNSIHKITSISNEGTEKDYAITTRVGSKGLITHNIGVAFSQMSSRLSEAEFFQIARQKFMNNLKKELGIG